VDNNKIKGGYYIKARSIKESEIAQSPPHVREIWDLLLRRANFKDRKINGRIIKRGQLFTSYREILDELSWKVGYRIERYKKYDCENTMKFLRSRAMITTSKTTRGIIITICNYEFYQNPKNYDNLSDNGNDYCNSPQASHTIHKKDNKENKERREVKLSSRRINFLRQILKYKKKYGRKMLKDFYNYWGEINTNGRKMRCEMKETFEVGKRLATWLKHEKEFRGEVEAEKKEEIPIGKLLSGFVGVALPYPTLHEAIQSYPAHERPRIVKYFESRGIKGNELLCEPREIFENLKKGKYK